METISYMVVEQGVHTLQDGSIIEASTTTANAEFSKISFTGTFEDAPVVISQITTQWKPKAYNTRQKYITNKSFKVRMQCEETETVTENEEISWVAWSMSASGSAGN
jgi:ribonuclease HI